MAVAVEKETRFMFMVDPTTGDLIRNRKMVVGGIQGEGDERALTFISEEEKDNYNSYVTRSKKNDGTTPTLLEAYDNLKAGKRASGKPRFWQQESGAQKKGEGKEQFVAKLKEILTENEITIADVPGGIEATYEGVTRLIKVK